MAKKRKLKRQTGPIIDRDITMIGDVTEADVVQELQDAYLDYAMSTIVARALPDVRDGLKPVHRRILYAGLKEAPPGGSKRKCVAVTGQTMKLYHPHGNIPIYEALVRMGQDFSYRYPLIDKQGNFGNIDGDPPAAERYTECRLSHVAGEMLADIAKDTVDMSPNFSGEELEPTVLPARVPCLLINGSVGIAVGMTTNIPPHNLPEVCSGLIRLLDKPTLSVEELMKDIKGPDFPTGGVVRGIGGIRSTYTTGHGHIIVRARHTIATDARGREQIVITEIPYMVSKGPLIEKIAALVEERKVEGIAALADESSMNNGIRIVITIRPDARAHVVLNNLYKHTSLQQTFGAILLALVDLKPVVCNLKQMLELYIEHRRDVIVRRTRFELKQAKDRAHILEGLRICLDHIDAIIALIKKAKDSETAQKQLQEGYGLTAIQAEQVLAMQLRRLSGLEREKIEQEYMALLIEIKRLEGILADDAKVREIIKQDLLEVSKKYGDERRTEISSEEPRELSDEDLIPQEEVVITLTHRGYIKRQAMRDFRQQRRGGQGVKVARPTAGAELPTGEKEEDYAEHMIAASTHEPILFFSERGRVFQVRGLEIPERDRTAKGMPINNLLEIENGEKVTAIANKPDPEKSGRFMVNVTKKGRIQRVATAEFNNLRRNGLNAMTILPDDELGWSFPTSGKDDILIVTEMGKAIRFAEGEVRASGRGTQGVGAIRMSKEDKVAGAAVARKDGELLVVTEHGFGKRTLLSEYSTQGRGGQGIFTYKVTDKVGRVASMRVLQEDDEEVVVITASGMVMRTAIEAINRMGRQTQGVTVMKLQGEDRIVAVAPVGSGE